MPLKVYGIEKAVNVPSSSGYCQKLETFLRATGYTDYTLHSTLPLFAPKGKVPYAEIDKKDTIADSHFIIQHLIRTGAARDLDVGLTPAQRADSRAWQAYVEELVYPATVWYRWGDPENYAKLRQVMFGSIPWIVRPLIEWFIVRRVHQGLWGHGVARHSPEEVREIITQYNENLEARLMLNEDKMFFFGGEEPTMADVVAYAFMVNVLSTSSNPVARSGILGSAKLCRYVVLLTKRWFPEYDVLMDAVDVEGVA